MSGVARIGCSGWVYKDWRGLFYPETAPAKTWFEHYSHHFDTVEINNSFYKLPTEQAADAWGRQAPPGFTYALKLGQFGSHRKKLKDPETWIDKHIDRVRRLGDHLGPNLVQLPPRWKSDAGRLDAFLDAVPKDIRWAVEMRDASWLTDDVYKVLEKHGAALCIHDLIAGHPWILTTSWTYIRFHGPRATIEPYNGRYTASRLWPIAKRLSRWLDEGTDVYGYFNNDWDANAVADAVYLRGRLSAYEAAAA